MWVADIADFHFCEWLDGESKKCSNETENIGIRELEACLFSAGSEASKMNSGYPSSGKVPIGTLMQPLVLHLIHQYPQKSQRRKTVS